MAVVGTRSAGPRLKDAKGSEQKSNRKSWPFLGRQELQEPRKGFPSSRRLLTSSRRNIRLGMALALIGASVALSLGVDFHGGKRLSVLVVTRPVALGQEIRASDLERVSVGGLRAGEYLPAADVPNIVGRTAAVGLQSGSLLVPGDLATKAVLPADESIVGLRLGQGALPGSQVSVGSHVMIVMTAGKGQPLSVPGGLSGLGSTSASGSDRGRMPRQTSVAGHDVGSGAFGGQMVSGGSLPAPLGAVLVNDAVVVGISADSSDSAHPGDEVVSVIVPLELAPAVMTAAASGQVSLALVGQRHG